MKTRLAEQLWRPPSFEVGALRLRGWEPSDAPAVFAYASDPEVAQYMAWERHRRQSDAEGFLNDLVARQYADRQLQYALCLRDAPSRAIGGLGCFWMPKEHKVMEIGYVLSREYWGRGLMPEAGRALIDLAFASTDVARIFAPIFAENHNSRHAAEKMGLTYEGTLRSEVELRGRRWDKAVYAIIRSEWHASRR